MKPPSKTQSKILPGLKISWKIIIENKLISFEKIIKDSNCLSKRANTRQVYLRSKILEGKTWFRNFKANSLVRKT